MLLILSLSLTTISCSKKKGASAPTSDSGGTTPTAITYYASDSMTIKPSTINNPSGKTITSCTCSNVPTGMTCSSSSPCQLTGSPTGTSTYNTTITANYSDNTSSSKEYTISYSSGNPPAPTLSSPTATGLDTSGATPVLTGTKNSAINTISFPSDHVVSSCSYTGTLPTGLTVNNDCSISGTPTGTTPSSGNSITVTPTNSGGTSSTTQTVKIIVPAPPEITLDSGNSPDATSSSATETTLTSLAGSSTTLKFNTTDYQVTGCSISPSSLPTGLSFNSTDCSITGTPSTTAQTSSTGSTFTITPSGTAGASTSPMSLTIKIYKKYCSNHTDSNTTSNGLKAGTGTVSDPYIICGRDGLKYLNSKASNNSYFVLQGDVNLNNAASPITSTFTGKFDGAGHIVSNQRVNSVATVASGIFSRVDDAIISNLSITNSSVYDSGYSGTIVGEVNTNLILSNILVLSSEVRTYNNSESSGLLIGYPADLATVSMSSILIYSSGTSNTNSNTRSVIGSPISGTTSFSKSYSNVIYDSAMTTSTSYVADSALEGGLNTSATPGAPTATSLSTIKNDHLLFTGFSGTYWSIPASDNTNTAPSLIKKEKAYTDGIFQ